MEFYVPPNFYYNTNGLKEDYFFMLDRELPLGKDLSDTNGRLFKKEPAINVIPKEEVDERVAKVFHLLWKTLSKSFGPYGAPTLIMNYPYSHVTKDGYTIMKNLSMDASETLVDQSIANMAEDICSRLNSAVGDGTTTAVIATNSIYQSYRKHADELRKLGLLPRDIIYWFKKISEKLVKELQVFCTEIRKDNPDELYEDIHNITYISSNGDETISDSIAYLYKELGYPGISCKMSDDGKNRAILIEGYQNSMVLNDKLYINSDNNTMDINNADLLIFSTKINDDIYEKILKPLNEECRARGRNLVVAAPFYDENTLTRKIKRDLNAEFNKANKVNLILTTYAARSSHDRMLIEDFAVLMGTSVIDLGIAKDIMMQLDYGVDICKLLNLDTREKLPDTAMVMAINYENRIIRKVRKETDLSKEIPAGFQLIEPEENALPVGYIKEASLGLRNSIFRGFSYNEAKYERILKDAKDKMEEVIEKYKRLGSFNIDITRTQERFYSLHLSMGMIEVGANSELSQKMLKDAVDDSIRAAESAFRYGIVRGCNVSLLHVLEEHVMNETDKIMKVLYQILYDGFKDVYGTVLKNSFPDKVLVDDMTTEVKFESIDDLIKIFNDDIDVQLKEGHPDTLVSVCKKIIKNNESVINTDMDARSFVCDLLVKYWEKFNKKTISLHDVIISASINTNTVFDVSKMEFSKNVFNSIRTDEEVLIAVIDLISLLIVGNQMVITGRNNF